MDGGREEIHDQAFVSLATNDQYGIGALVLGHSLRRVNTTRRLALLITDGVTPPIRNQLEQVWDSLILVSELDSSDSDNLALLARPELGITFTKLKVWTLTQYKKCVFLDADTLVVQNVDELFDRPELSAAPDIGWPDIFNSGVFVFEPLMSTYHGLLEHAITHGSFDGGDQGLLNMYFKDWATKDISHHLPFLYNMVSNVCYTYAPAYKQFGKDVKIVHFLGAIKPWHHSFNRSTGTVNLLPSTKATQFDQHLVQLWWNARSEVQQKLEKVKTGSNSFDMSVWDSGTGHQTIQLLEPQPERDSEMGHQTIKLLEPQPERDSEIGHQSVKSLETQPEISMNEVAQAAEPEESHVEQQPPDPTQTDAIPQDSERERQSAWEHGTIDYAGKDRFSKIRRHLDNVIYGSDESGDEDSGVEDIIVESSHEGPVIEWDYYRPPIVGSQNDYGGFPADSYSNKESHPIEEWKGGNRAHSDETKPTSSVDKPKEQYVSKDHSTEKVGPDPTIENKSPVSFSGDEDGYLTEDWDEKDASSAEEIDTEEGWKENWERGAIDFTGKDRFSFIEKYLDAILQKEAQLLLARREKAEKRALSKRRKLKRKRELNEDLPNEDLLDEDQNIEKASSEEADEVIKFKNKETQTVVSYSSVDEELPTFAKKMICEATQTEYPKYKDKSIQTE